jgi:FixJ family two-component response regulator
MRIAIVDDDGSVRAGLRALLRSQGMEAVAYASAEAFLADAGEAEDTFDCLIADLRLPGMSGAALVRALAEAGRAIPAVLITAHDDAASRAMLRGVAPIPVLRKPFGGAALADAIRRARSA